MESIVSIRPCKAYEASLLEEAIGRAIEDIGGLVPYLSPGETVLLKVNLILSKDPERMATTHPAFVTALAKALVSYGCKVYIGDSSGGPFNAPLLKRTYLVTGMEEAARQSGAELCMETDSVEIAYPKGTMLKKLTVSKMSQMYDKVISVCKLKTHSMMTYTGAVKNMFGIIPGTMKSEYHVRMPQMSDFAEAMIDICQSTPPVLSFMDAVVGLEGNGPTAGEPRPVGCILASPSPHALDKAAVQIIGLKPENILTLSAAAKRGLVPDIISYPGSRPEDFLVPDYKMPDNIHLDLSGGGLLPPFLMKLLRPKVVFSPAKCIGCGVCERDCPPKVITLRERKRKRSLMRSRTKNEALQSKAAKGGKLPKLPHTDHSRCIRCYCCQELCPQEAVSIRENILYKIVNRL